MTATANILTTGHSQARRLSFPRRWPAWAWCSAISAPARSIRSTSPSKAASPTGQATPEAVLGIVSLIFWSLIIVISIKYAILIMRADNHGEGGMLALLALVSPQRAKDSNGAPCWSSSASSARRCSMATERSPRRFRC